MDLLPATSELELNEDKDNEKEKEKEKNKETEVTLTIAEDKDEEDKLLQKKTSTYASKKAVAQRMMDIALLTSNANQLRYVLRYGDVSASFGISVALIALSLALQVFVGIFLIFRVKASSTRAEKERANSLVVGGVFLITIVNVLTTAFSLEEPTVLNSESTPSTGISTATRTMDLTDLINNSQIKNVASTGS